MATIPQPTSEVNTSVRIELFALAALHVIVPLPRVDHLQICAALAYHGAAALALALRPASIVDELSLRTFFHRKVAVGTLWRRLYAPAMMLILPPVALISASSGIDEQGATAIAIDWLIGTEETLHTSAHYHKFISVLYNIPILGGRNKVEFSSESQFGFVCIKQQQVLYNDWYFEKL